MIGDGYTVEDMMAEAGLEGDYSEVETGDIVQTYMVENGKTYFLQFPDENPNSVRRGIVTLEYLQDTDIPLPEIVYSDTEVPVLVTSAAEGVPLEERESENTFYDAGRVLGEIHDAQRFDHSGLAVRSPNGIRPIKPDTWIDSLSLIHRHRMANANDLVGMDLDRQIEDAYQEGIELVPRNSGNALLHFDYTPDNIISQNGSVSAVLDWDHAFIGDPDFEFVRARRELERSSDPADAFEDGYRSVRSPSLGLELEDFYRMEAEITHLSALSFLDNSGARELDEEDVEESREELEEILEKL